LLYGPEVRALAIQFPSQVSVFFKIVDERVAKAETAVAKSGKHNKFAKMTDTGNSADETTEAKGCLKRRWVWTADSYIVMLFGVCSFLGSAAYIIVNPLQVAFSQRGFPYDHRPALYEWLYTIDAFFIIDIYMRLAHFIPEGSCVDEQNQIGGAGGATSEHAARYGGWDKVPYLKRIIGLGGRYLRSRIGFLAIISVLPIDWVSWRSNCLFVCLFVCWFLPVLAKTTQR
jgi:hypothetical protein